MTREQIAERVGYYFGLQHAGNLKLPFARNDSMDIAINAFRKMVDAEMEKTKAGLPPGTIDNWPKIPATPET